MEGRDVSMTIQHLIFHLKQLAETLPHGYQSDVLAWVRVSDAGEFAVLQVSEVQQGYHQDHGGSIATICLDQRA